MVNQTGLIALVPISVEQWYTKTETEHNVLFSAVDSFSIKDNVYYTNGTMSAVVSGTYYKRVSRMTCLYYINSNVLLAYKDVLGIDLYTKATFLNGVKSVQGIVAVSGYATMTIPPTDDNPGKINIDTSNK